MSNLFTLILLIISIITLSVIFDLLKKYKKDNQIKKMFLAIIVLAIWWVALELVHIIFKNYIDMPDEYDIYFASLASIGKCFMPVFIFLLGLVFSKTKINFNKKYLLLFIIPTVTIVLMLTNQLHYLVYKTYSIYTYKSVLGPYSIVHQLYSYGMLMIGMFLLLRSSIKNAGFFSKQSLLIVLGTLIPLVVNIMETFKIVHLTVYSTPISFAFAVAIYALAIFKFKFLSVSPIALQKIVDRMSDSYLVLNDDGTITDFNQTFITTFKIDYTTLRGQNFEEFSKKHKINYGKIKNAILKTKDSNKTISFEHRVNRIHKIFTVEINTIYSDGASLGTLILFKDITQHIEDMETIKNNQDILMERERLASLGQLIGGIAHNLKTPIMSISGAAEGLTDLVKEYDSSIDDPEVNSQDHHDIAKDMNEWIVKIKEYTEYMSDIITAVKGQAVTLSETENISFDIDELVKRVDILMKHELKNALIYMNVQMKAPKTTKIHGDINSFVQVINNMISNAIQAYNGKTEQNIDLILEKSNGNLIISVKDYGCGLPQKVQDKLFKEMITTKGKNGTGLGLYMSYSTIKAHFNGNITFETEEGKGTTFNIILPL